MSNKYYISDLHFFHENVIKFSNRPFVVIEEMHGVLIEKWNNKVDSGDIVYILGDLSFNKDIHALINILKQLNGQKHLIIGNHDGRWLKSYKNQINEKIFDSIEMYKSVNDKERRVILMHYPIEDWDGKYRNSYHLHGHIHDNESLIRKIDRRFNVSCEVLNYEPKSLDELIELNK